MRKEYDLYVKLGKCGDPQPCIDCHPPRIICKDKPSNPCCDANYCKTDQQVGCGCQKSKPADPVIVQEVYTAPVEEKIFEQEIDFEIPEEEFEIRTDIRF